jgi:hypothetical protein
MMTLGGWRRCYDKTCRYRGQHLRVSCGVEGRARVCVNIVEGQPALWLNSLASTAFTVHDKGPL